MPLLQRQRALYDLPRGMERFQRYVTILRNEPGEPLVPMAAMNPMGKEKATSAFDALLAIDAESIAGQAVSDVAARLRSLDGGLKVGLTVADDVEGGWTERYQTELQSLLGTGGQASRSWAVAVFWSSEAAHPGTVRSTVLAAVYRTLHQRRHGPPATLGALLVQEGRARAFAGEGPPAGFAAAPVSIALAPHLGKQDFGTLIAALHGDEAARHLGYPALGVPAAGGLHLAISQASVAPSPPESFL